MSFQFLRSLQVRPFVSVCRIKTTRFLVLSSRVFFILQLRPSICLMQTCELSQHSTPEDTSSVQKNTYPYLPLLSSPSNLTKTPNFPAISVAPTTGAAKNQRALTLILRVSGAVQAHLMEKPIQADLELGLCSIRKAVSTVTYKNLSRKVQLKGARFRKKGVTGVWGRRDWVVGMCQLRAMAVLWGVGRRGRVRYSGCVPTVGIRMGTGGGRVGSAIEWVQWSSFQKVKAALVARGRAGLRCRRMWFDRGYPSNPLRRSLRDWRMWTGGLISWIGGFPCEFFLFRFFIWCLTFSCWGNG